MDCYFPGAIVYGGVWVLLSLTHLSFWYCNLVLVSRNNSNCPSRMEPNQEALTDSLSPTDRMWYCFWLLLFWVPPTNLNPQWWISKRERFKTMFGAIVIMVFGCLICPCVLPLVMQSILSLLKDMVKQKTTAQLHLLQGYWRVNPIPEDKNDDAFWQIMCQSIKEGNVGVDVAIFLGFTMCLE
jgi:hypothetical protein